MSTLVRFVSTPSRLHWWEWGRILGLAGVTSLAGMVLAGHVPPAAVIAVVLHVTGDFTVQSDETAARKGERGRHLLAHALVAGGLPLAVAGLAIGHLSIVLSWAVAGAASHYLIDWTRKFGIRSTLASVVLDQAAHVATILTVVLVGGVP